ncbi:hypothetical protein ASZ90_011235 [hydrocarbon metagenome]|uniref:Uncharacterized protein n=1 Tax=hydrocarbon metagenome TaxID=938273 RepID=A0A0W8FFJ8_9ZZZZ
MSGRPSTAVCMPVARFGTGILFPVLSLTGKYADEAAGGM